MHPSRHAPIPWGAVVAAGALALAGCASPGPYAEVTGERIGAADLHEAEVRIAGVDGRLDAGGSTSVVLEPGFRMVLVRNTRIEGRRMAAEAMLPLDAKPCMRYYVVARHESMSRVEPWSLEIKKVEPIAECAARFPQAAGSR